jgi:hypothetical protein
MANPMNIHNLSITIPEPRVNSPIVHPIALVLEETFPPLNEVIPLTMDISDYIDCKNEPDAIQIRYIHGQIIHTNKTHTLEILSHNFNDIAKISWDGPNFRKKLVFDKFNNLDYILILNIDDFNYTWSRVHNENYWYGMPIIDMIRLN